MEKTLLLIKPDGVARGLIGKVISKFEEKGLTLIGLKMMQLDDTILDEHYSHLKDKPFFPNIKDFMKFTPIIVSCWKGKEAVSVARNLCGPTNSREAPIGTIRGDFGMSIQANIVHSSDSVESAIIEIERFFNNNELFDHNSLFLNLLYSKNEL